MSYYKISDDTLWPRPELASDDESVAWKLTWGRELTKQERLFASSVIAAYGYLLVEASSAKIALVARDMKARLKEES